MTRSRETAIDLAAEAFKQWASEGTVSAKYLESVLGSEEPIAAGATAIKPTSHGNDEERSR